MPRTLQGGQQCVIIWYGPTQAGCPPMLVWKQAVAWPPPRFRDKPVFWDKYDMKRTCSLVVFRTGYFWHILSSKSDKLHHLVLGPWDLIGENCFGLNTNCVMLTSVLHHQNQHLSPSLQVRGYVHYLLWRTNLVKRLHMVSRNYQWSKKWQVWLPSGNRPDTRPKE